MVRGPLWIPAHTDVVLSAKVHIAIAENVGEEVARVHRGYPFSSEHVLNAS